MKVCALAILACGMLHGNWAAVDDARVYYEVAGGGLPAVVLVHGWTCDLSSWKAQRSDLGKHFRVLALDLPGHGRSDKPEREYTADYLARGVEAAMGAAGVKRAVLVGHSMGVPVIRRVLERNPGIVLALISLDGALLRGTPPGLKQYADSFQGPDGLAARRKFIERMFVDSTPESLRGEIMTMMLAAPPHVAASAMASAVGSDVWDSPPATVPVLAINQEARGRTMRPLHEQVFRNLEYHELTGVSHFLHMEKPAEVNRLMIEFIKKAGK